MSATPPPKTITGTGVPRQGFVVNWPDVKSRPVVDAQPAPPKPPNPGPGPSR